jgi:hypothetical protein
MSTPETGIFGGPLGHATEPRAARPAAPTGTKVPPAPRSLEEAGLTGEAVDELILKTLYVQGVRTGRELTEFIALPHPLLDERLMLLQQRRLVAVGGTTGPNRGSYRFDLTDAGRERAREAMHASQYVGPAPVPLATFEEWIGRQSLRHVRVTPDTVTEGFGSLVLDPALFDLLGPPSTRPVRSSCTASPGTARPPSPRSSPTSWAGASSYRAPSILRDRR